VPALHDTHLAAAAWAALSAALFGAALVTTHSGLKYLDARRGARVSIPTATALFWLLAPWLDLEGWDSAAVGIFALVGLFFPAAVTLLTFESNRRLGPNVTGAIGSTAPLFAVLGAALWLSEPLGGGALAATALIVAGSVSLSRPPAGATPAARRGGAWLAWTSAALRALAQVLSKAGLALWPNPFAAVLVGYTVSSAAVWATPLAGGKGSPAFNRGGIAWFAATGLLNGIAVLALYCALARGPVYLVSPIAATYPLFTLVLSVLLLREERVGGALIAGVALTVGGVIVLLVTR
jgi:drug/metabolite transporter (DMT)-like permease